MEKSTTVQNSNSVADPEILAFQVQFEERIQMGREHNMSVAVFEGTTLAKPGVPVRDRMIAKLSSSIQRVN